MKKLLTGKAGSSPSDPISKTELLVLKVLWEQGPATVREIHSVLTEQGRDWAYTTVLTLLQRLESKGYVTSEKSGIAHIFRPLVSREGLLLHRLRELAWEVTDGAATPLVQALVEGHRFSEEDIEWFRELLDRVEPRKRERRQKSQRRK